MGKFRQKYNKFVVEGHKSCIEFLLSGKYKIHTILAYSEWIEKQSGLLHHCEDIRVVNQSEMHAISHLKTPSPVFLVCEIPSHNTSNISITRSWIYLDDVQDPGNVGTIIRVADWFGVQGIIRSSSTADFYNPKVVQASMGSLCNVYLISCDFAELLTLSLPHSIIAATLEGIPLKEFHWPHKFVLVIGNEGRGVNPNIFKGAHSIITIPGSSSRVADSLNAAISTAVICSHIAH